MEWSARSWGPNEAQGTRASIAQTPQRQRGRPVTPSALARHPGSMSELSQLRSGIAAVLQSRAIRSLGRFALGLLIGMVAVALLARWQGLSDPFRHDGREAQIAATMAFCCAGLAGGLLMGRTLGWLGLMVGLVIGVTAAYRFKSTEGRIGASAVFTAFFDQIGFLGIAVWAVVAGSVSYLLGALVRGRVRS
jgi:hypothetical protein